MARITRIQDKYPGCLTTHLLLRSLGLETRRSFLQHYISETSLYNDSDLDELPDATMSEPNTSGWDQLPFHNISESDPPTWDGLAVELRLMIYRKVVKACFCNIDDHIDDIAKTIDGPINQEQLERPITHPLAQVNRLSRREFFPLYRSGVTLQATILDLNHSKLIHYLNRSKYAYLGYKSPAIQRAQQIGPGNDFREIVVDPLPETHQVINYARLTRNLHIRLCLGEMLNYPEGTNLTLDDLAVRAIKFVDYFVDPSLAEVERSLYSITYECEPLLGIFRDILVRALEIAWEKQQQGERGPGDSLGLDALVLMRRAVQNCEQIDGRRKAVVSVDDSTTASGEAV